nr:FeoB-associated Cys-rich membrane protein [uncultured Caproiciproducens sp.]
MATIIIGTIVFAAMAAAAWYTIKAHKAGKCVGCSGCNGHCEHCSEEVKKKVNKV